LRHIFARLPTADFRDGLLVLMWEPDLNENRTKVEMP